MRGQKESSVCVKGKVKAHPENNRNSHACWDRSNEAMPFWVWQVFEKALEGFVSAQMFQPNTSTKRWWRKHTTRPNGFESSPLLYFPPSLSQLFGTLGYDSPTQNTVLGSVLFLQIIHRRTLKLCSRSHSWWSWEETPIVLIPVASHNYSSICTLPSPQISVYYMQVWSFSIYKPLNKFEWVCSISIISHFKGTKRKNGTHSNVTSLGWFLNRIKQ